MMREREGLFGGARVDGLDVLRAVAAMLVVFYHLFELGPPAMKALLLWPPNPYGWIGVDLFFVLSGFFIGRLVLEPARFRPGAFVVRRALRILPAYYFSMLAIVLFLRPEMVFSANGWWHLLTHAALFHNLLPDHHGSINGVYWTLGVEWQFYLLMLLAAPLLRRPRALMPVLLLALLACWAYRTAIYLHGSDNLMLRFQHGTQLPGMLDLFVAGILCAWLSLRHPAALRRWGPVLLAVGVVITVPTLRYLQSHIGDYWTHGFSIIGTRSLMAVCFGMLILGMLHPPRWLIVPLDRLGVTRLGQYSYSVYLFHLPLLLAMAPHIPADWGRGGMLLVIAMYLLATVAVSRFVYRHVELPWIERGREWTRDMGSSGSTANVRRDMAKANEAAAP